MDVVARRRVATVAYGEVVWSWRPLAGAKLAGDDPQGDGD
jgi:hypothetical protein